MPARAPGPLSRFGLIPRSSISRITPSNRVAVQSPSYWPSSVLNSIALVPGFVEALYCLRRLSYRRHFWGPQVPVEIGLCRVIPAPLRDCRSFRNPGFVGVHRRYGSNLNYRVLRGLEQKLKMVSSPRPSKRAPSRQPERFRSDLQAHGFYSEVFFTRWFSG
jgi:hypothetical protein